MTELEDGVRDMLRSRASDIDSLPPRLTQVPDLESFDGPAKARRPGTAWLVAAAAVAILVVAATVVAVGGRRDGAQPPAHRVSTSATTPPVPSTSATKPPVPSTHVARKVQLAWFGMSAVPGFRQHLWTSEPGRRTLAIRADRDKDAPVGCNGCVMASDYITVFDRQAFDAARRKVSTWSQVSVSGHIAYLGSMARYGVRDSVGVPTLAWPFGSDQWAIVQGVTALGGRSSVLRQLAAAIHPDQAVPITLPFRVDHLADLPLARVEDDRGAGYAFTMDFGPDENGTSFTIRLWNGSSFAGLYDTSHATRRSVGGLPGYFDADAIGVRYRGGIAVLGFGGDWADPSTLTGAGRAAAVRQAAERRAELEMVADSIHWTNGDGRPPYVDAETAIP